MQAAIAEQKPFALTVVPGVQGGMGRDAVRCWRVGGSGAPLLPFQLRHRRTRVPAAHSAMLMCPCLPHLLLAGPPSRAGGLRVVLEFRPAGNDSFSDGAPQIGIPSFVQQQRGGGRGAASSLHIVVLKPLPQTAPAVVAEAKAGAAADSTAAAAGMPGEQAEAGPPALVLPRLHPTPPLPPPSSKESGARTTAASLGSEPETPKETHERVLEASGICCLFLFWPVPGVVGKRRPLAGVDPCMPAAQAACLPAASPAGAAPTASS